MMTMVMGMIASCDDGGDDFGYMVVTICDDGDDDDCN